MLDIIYMLTNPKFFSNSESLLNYIDKGTLRSSQREYLFIKNGYIQMLHFKSILSLLLIRSYYNPLLFQIIRILSTYRFQSFIFKYVVSFYLQRYSCGYLLELAMMKKIKLVLCL